MIDESMDTEQMSKEPEPWEPLKPAWQRLIIMLGGVTVNVILAFFIYVFAFMTWGDNTTYKMLVMVFIGDSLALAAGFEHGDKIVTVDGKSIERQSQIIPEIILNDAQKIRVDRSGVQTDIYLSEDIKTAMLKKTNLFRVGWPFIIQKFSKDSPLEAAGAQVNDRILTINNNDMQFANQVFEYIPTLRGDTANIIVERRVRRFL